LATMAEMRKIPVDELKPGMRFDKPVYIDSNNMLVAANVSIKLEDIKKLMRWGVSEVETAGNLVSTEQEIKAATARATMTESDEAKKIIDDYNKLLTQRVPLIEIHKEACKAVANVHNAIKADGQFSIDEIDVALTKIMDIMKNYPNIFLFLYGLEEGKNYLVVHSVNVTFYSLLIGMALKYTPIKLRELGIGTMLIDAGMIKLPAYIMHKQSNLTEHEFNQIKTHPLHGYKALRQLGKIPEKSALVCLQHHEQYDGKGYPRGLKGTQIDEYARIASIADSYEAQIANRAYRKRVFFYQAMKNMLSSGINKFDPVILRVFLSRMSVYPIGSIVELNNGTIGIVIGSIPQKPLRPIVKLIIDSNKKRFTDTIIVNLLEEKALYITRALDETEIGVNLFEVL